MMYHELQPSIQVLTPLLIHWSDNRWVWYTIVQAAKQLDHIYTGHITIQGCTIDRWMKTGTFLALALDGVWCTVIVSSNHPYMIYMLTPHSQFINGCTVYTYTPLYKQQSNGITSILATQYPKDILWVDGWKLEHFPHLPWMMCDVLWDSTIHIGIDTTLNSSTRSWMKLIHHCTSSQAIGLHPYYRHNTPRMDQHGRMKTGTLLALALDGVWWTMNSNHQYIYWQHSQFIGGCMDGIDTPLHKQSSKGITSTQTTQYSKDGSTWMKEYWHISCSCLCWCMMYHDLQSSI